jgi:hypothetical protein
MVRPGIELALCGERLVTNHLNQWIQESEGSFLSNAPLFPKSTDFWKVAGLSPCKFTMQVCGALVD